MPPPGGRIALALAVLLIAAGPARADDLPGLPPDSPAGAVGGVAGLLTLFDPAVPPGLGARVPFGYSATWSPAQPVAGSPADFGSVRQDAVARLPLWPPGPDALFGVFGVRHIYTRTDAVLPDSGRRFPANLWDIRAGVLYRRELADGWSAGAAVVASSPSDQPFGSPREQAFALAGFVQAPAAAAGDYWLLALTYDSVGELSFPVPGLAYLWNPSDRLSAALGLPLAVAWRPVDGLRLDFGYLPVRRVRSQVTWEATPDVDVFAGFEWAGEAYLLADRADKDERLYSYQKRVPVGVRVRVTDHGVLDVAGGYAFDRFYFAGRGYDDRYQDRIDIGSGFFLQARFALRY
ncbi:MAG TPA: hypothetical protein VD866_07300 [Urbifossiella sp.]|nr:hypothetical protein [Urbifossiella sp.]